jgi:hypothetical protein
MEIKPYTITTTITLVAAGAMGIAAAMNGLQPVARNNARNDALTQVINNLRADNCLVANNQPMPRIGALVELSGEGKLPTSCLFYPNHKRFAYIGQLNHQLQIIYVYTQLEVRKANGNGKTSRE